jgi:hypothetical protein
MKSADWAAIAQAAAAFVALGISVWAVLRQGAAERQRERVRARGIAVAIYPGLLKLDVELRRAHNTLHAPLPNRLEGLSGVQAELITAITVTLPSIIERHYDSLFVLGEPAGSTTIQLVSVLVQYCEMVVTAHQRMREKGFQVEVIQRNIKPLKAHVELLRRTVAAAIAEVGPVYDPIKG